MKLYETGDSVNPKNINHLNRPKEISTHYWLAEQTDLFAAAAQIDSKYQNDRNFWTFKLPGLEFSELQNDALRAFDRFGWYGFANLFQGGKIIRSKYYGGLGLTYNPNYLLDVDPHAQVFGSPAGSNLPRNFFSTSYGQSVFSRLIENQLDKVFIYKIAHMPIDYVKSWLIDQRILSSDEADRFLSDAKESGIKIEQEIARDNYQDCYGFNQKTEAGKFGSIGHLLDQFKRTLIRSRLAEIRSAFGNPTANLKMRHRDENIFFELRLIFTLKADPEGKFGIWVDGVGDVPIKAEGIYHFDNSIAHTATCHNFGNHSRINLVVAATPWFDFDSERMTWEPNQFFGKKHPLDMLIDGDVIEGLEVVA